MRRTQSHPPTAGPSAGGSIPFALTSIIGIGVLAQAVLAGVFVGGHHPHAVNVHQLVGPLLVLPAIATAVLIRVRLRGTPRGRRAFPTGVGITAALIAETALGLASDDHPGILALHVPVGVALFGLLAYQLQVLRHPQPPQCTDKRNRRSGGPNRHTLMLVATNPLCPGSRRIGRHLRLLPPVRLGRTPSRRQRGGN
jgi:hypothetical protein